MSFDRALPFVLAREGGYVNDPDDPGGATNKGVTQAVYDAWRTSRGEPVRSVKEIESFEVQGIYRKQYWEASGAEEYPWPMCLAVFDAAVNHGVSRARGFAKECPTFESFLARREAFYRGIVAHRPASGKFLNGWLNRLKHLREVAV